MQPVGICMNGHPATRNPDTKLTSGLPRYTQTEACLPAASGCLRKEAQHWCSVNAPGHHAVWWAEHTLRSYLGVRGDSSGQANPSALKGSQNSTELLNHGSWAVGAARLPQHRAHLAGLYCASFVTLRLGLFCIRECSSHVTSFEFSAPAQRRLGPEQVLEASLPQQQCQ